MKKRLIICVLCVLILLSAGSAFAVDQNAVQVFGSETKGTTLDVLLYARANSAFSEKNFSISVGGTELPVKGMQPYSAENCGTSWIVVMEPNAYESVQKMVAGLVRSLAAELKGKDTLTIYNASRNEKNEFLTAESTIIQLADAVLKSNGEIRLYDTLNTALNTFKTSTELNARKCLLIITEGADKGSSYTLTEACKTASQLPITVYTVGTTRGSESLTNNFKEISELTRTTGSGIAVAVDNYSRPEEEGAAVANQILDNEKNCYILSASLNNLKEHQPDTTEIKTTLQLDKERLEASLSDVDGRPINAAIDAANEIQTESVPNTFPQNVIYQIKQYWPIEDSRINIAIAAAVAVLVLLLIIGAAKKKAKRRASEAAVEPEVAEEPDGTETGMPEENGGTMPLSKVTITLTNVKTGEAVSGNIYDYSLKAGRSSKLALLGDASISGEHMEFIWQNGCLYVQDTNSTNGTKVNGKDIRGAVALNQSDMIHAGKSDFRVNWRSNM